MFYILSLLLMQLPTYIFFHQNTHISVLPFTIISFMLQCFYFYFMQLTLWKEVPFLIYDYLFCNALRYKARVLVLVYNYQPPFINHSNTSSYRCYINFLELHNRKTKRAVKTTAAVGVCWLIYILHT